MGVQWHVAQSTGICVPRVDRDLSQPWHMREHVRVCVCV